MSANSVSAALPFVPPMPRMYTFPCQLLLSSLLLLVEDVAVAAGCCWSLLPVVSRYCTLSVIRVGR